MGAATRHRLGVHQSRTSCAERLRLRFNRTYRFKVLDAHRFETLADTRAETARWLEVYNEQRLHGAVGYPPPTVFKRR